MCALAFHAGVRCIARLKVFRRVWRRVWRRVRAIARHSRKSLLQKKEWLKFLSFSFPTLNFHYLLSFFDRDFTFYKSNLSSKTWTKLMSSKKFWNIFVSSLQTLKMSTIVLHLLEHVPKQTYAPIVDNFQPFTWGKILYIYIVHYIYISVLEHSISDSYYSEIHALVFILVNCQ